MGNTLKKIAARSVLLGAAFFMAAGVAEPREVTPVNEQPANPKNQNLINLPDLTAHPLAGSEVEMQLVVKDALQSGRSQTVRVKLPQMTFRNAMNLEIAAFRRDLAINSRNAKAVAGKLNAFIDANANKFKNPATLISLKAVSGYLSAAKAPAELDQVVTDLWRVMMMIEEDSMTDAEKKLRDAEKALEEALKENVSPEELKKRMEEAQRAMEERMKEKLQDKALSEEDKKALEEMQKMMEEMQKLREEMEKNKPADAQKMLEQMKQMQQKNPPSKGQMQKNMQEMMEQMKQEMQEMKEMKERMDALQKLIDEQKKLIEESKELDKERQDGDVADMKVVQDKLEKLARKQQNDVNKQIEKETDNNAKVPLNGFNYDLNAILRDLKNIRDDGDLLTEAEAQKMIDTMRKIQEELQKRNPQQKEDKALDESQKEVNKSGDQKKMQDLEHRQDELQRQIDQMMKDMMKKGKDPGKLKEASQQMGDSSKKLGQGEAGQSVPDQNGALESMQQAMQQMQQQMQQGQGSGAPEVGFKGDDLKDKPDPLGRSNPGQDMGVDPVGGINHTRVIRDQIRGKLNDPALAPRDRQYLERLLNGDGQQGPRP